MSDQQQGAGWWQASDGRWYPPEQHPSVVPPDGWVAPSAPPAPPSLAPPWASPQWSGPPAAPLPPKRGMSTGAKVALVLGIPLGLLVVLVMVVTLLGTSDDPDAVPVTAVVPESFVRFEDPAGEFTIEIEPEWISLSLRGDLTGLGAQTAPEDPDQAAAIDAAVAAAPRQLVFAALDPENLGTARFVANINIAPVPRDGASIDVIEREIPASVELFGAGDAVVERVETSNGDGLRMSYRFEPGGPLSGVEGLQYYLIGEETVWVLTLTSDDMAGDRADFEASVEAFSPAS